MLQSAYHSSDNVLFFIYQPLFISLCLLFLFIDPCSLVFVSLSDPSLHIICCQFSFAVSSRSLSVLFFPQHPDFFFDVVSISLSFPTFTFPFTADGILLHLLADVTFKP